MSVPSTVWTKRLRPAQRPHGVRHAAVAALGQLQVAGGESEEIFLAGVNGWLYMNGHFRNRLIGGTIYKAHGRGYIPSSYGQKYGTVAPF